MPIYEYRCTSCGKVVEVLASTAHDQVTLPACGCGNGSHFTRLYSTFAAHTEGHAEPQFASCDREGGCRECPLRDEGN